MLNEKSKKLQGLRLGLSELSQEKIDWIANALLHLAKFDFRAQFLAWYLKNKLDEEADPEKAQAIQEGIDQAYLMTDQLIDFISMDGNEQLLESIDTKQVKKKRKTIMLDHTKMKMIEKLQPTLKK